MESEVTCFQPQLLVIPLSGLVMGERQLDPGKTYICSFPDCKASYNKSWKLEAHMCKHTGVKPFVCEAEGCSKAFSTKYHRARHMITHTGERPFRCPEEGCPQAFTTRANVRKHVARKHEHKEKLYVCEYEGCGKGFKKNNQLKIHECQHTNVLPFKCNFEGCEMRFGFPSNLKRHEKVHQGYPCAEKECDFLGKTWTEYLKHRREEHKAQYRCSKCDRVLSSSWNLQQHELTHEAVRQVFCCPREGCVRTYSTASNLQTHILSFHEQCRPFACPHPSCTKTFVLKASLKQHSVKHEPQKCKVERKPRPRRSLASRLSGYQPKRGNPEEPGKLTVMLQDTSLGEVDKPTLTPPL